MVVFFDLSLELIGYSDIFIVLLNKLLQKYAEVVFVDIFLRAVRVFSSGAVIVDEVIEYYHDRPTVVMGHSRGGTHALLAGTTNPYVTQFVAIMSHHGPTTVGLPKEGESVSISYRDLPPGTSRTEEQKEFRLPTAYFSDQLQYDALPALKASTRPKLFVYGTKDVLVSTESVQSMYNDSAEPKLIHAVETEHDYRLHPEAINEVNETIGEFLDNYSGRVS